MITDYTPFIDRVIKNYEGGYGWNEKDPGGPTKYGITCYDLAEHRGQKMNSMSAWAPKVQAMDLSEAEAIYRVKYAGGIRFDDLPIGVDCVLLDYAINSGVSRAVHVARTVLGLPAGEMDQALLDKAKQVQASTFIDVICNERINFMHTIRGGSAWAEFGHGWLTRVTDLRAYAHALASRTNAAQPPDLTKVVQPKATNVPKTATTPTAGGAVATGGAMAAAGYHWIPIAVAIAGVVTAGVAYEIWEDRKAKAANNKVRV